MSALDKLLENVDYSAFGYTQGLRIAKEADEELAQLRADNTLLQKNLDEVKIAFIKYENESNHIHAWRDFTYSLHAILNIPTK